jgi:hypothetical protein
MKGLVAVALLLTSTLGQAASERHANWRGIVPLHSTRADVEQLLGQPSPPPKDGSWLYTPNPNIPLYFLEDENVRIGYMTDEMAARTGCSPVPTDTVLWIDVSFKNHPPLSAIGIDESRFETFDPSYPPNIGFKAYVDIIDGMYVCTEDGEVNRLGYYGDARDRQACPGLNHDPKDFCSVLVDFGKQKPKTPKD